MSRDIDNEHDVDCNDADDRDDDDDDDIVVLHAAFPARLVGCQMAKYKRALRCKSHVKKYRF